MKKELNLSSLLACPTCKGKLEEKKERLQCKSCKQEYLIQKGIPILLPKEGGSV